MGYLNQSGCSYFRYDAPLKASEDLGTATPYLHILSLTSCTRAQHTRISSFCGYFDRVRADVGKMDCGSARFFIQRTTPKLEQRANIWSTIFLMAILYEIRECPSLSTWLSNSSYHPTY
jgi:hypothetical protein